MRAPHGTMVRYDQGCRCTACVLTQARRDQDRHVTTHGTVSTYNRHSCRCDACRRAAADLRAEQRARRLTTGTPPAGENHAWQDLGACRSYPLSVFFPVTANYGPAKTICAGCDVRAKCLAYALRTDQPEGVWGGLSVQERRQLRRRTA